MSIDIRPLLHDHPDPDEAFKLLWQVDSRAFDEEASPQHLANERALLELDRAFIAWDRATPIGCEAIFSMEFSVPGGQIPVAGVTWVGVLPTHRRQGAMSQLLAAAHREIHQAGKEPVAALWASQPPIYGRFGYGLAAPSLSVVIPRSHGSISRAPSNHDLTLHLVEPAEDFTQSLAVYSRVRARRPGMPTVDKRWHASNVSDPTDDREGSSPLRTVVVESADGPQGYARYAIKHNWHAGYADGVIQVRQLMATQPEAEAALWRYLIEFDLASSVDAWNLPSDTPLQHWLDQPRHCRRQLHDSLYVRLIDVGEALAARTYSVPIDLVVDVRDRHCPWNAGRWRLSGDESGGTCSRTTDTADLVMDVATLGAAYLGGTTLNDLATAAWIEARNEETVRRASRAFGHYPAPWSPFVF